MEAVTHARYLCVTNRGKSLPRFFENIGAKVLHAMLFTGANDGHRPCTLHGCNPQIATATHLTPYM